MILVAKKTQRVNHNGVTHDLIKGKKINKTLEKSLSDYAKECLFEEAEKENFIEVKIDKVEVKSRKEVYKVKEQAEQVIAKALAEAEKKLEEAKAINAEAEKKLKEAKKLNAETKALKVKAEKEAKK